MFTVRGDSAREAWGFVLAVMQRVSSEDERHSYLARTIVADDEATVRELQHLRNHIVVIQQPRGQVSGALVEDGCHVVVSEGNDAHAERNVIILPRPRHREFTEALRGMGLSEDDAERTARECGLSTTIFQRRRAQANGEWPSWADGDSAKVLLPAVLVGRWSNQSHDDQEVLRWLADPDDYASVETNLQRFLSVDDPPLRRIGDVWTLAAPVDAFQLTARHLTTADLDRFRDRVSQGFRQD